MTVYEKVTQRIIEQLEKGVIPWRKTWTGRHSVNWVTQKEYKGINCLLLDGGEYITYKQCIENGGKVKKGAKANIVIFWKWYEKTTEDNNVELLPVLRYYTVFHISDCVGIHTKITVDSTNTHNLSADNVIQEYTNTQGITLKTYEGSLSAYYNPIDDTIVLPNIQQFDCSESYYATVFHELVHSTGHKTRLDRIKSTVFASYEYSLEELVAEIGSSMIMSETGMEMPDTFENSVAYINSWLKVLRENNRIIVNASAKAEKAVKMILGQEVTLYE